MMSYRASINVGELVTEYVRKHNERYDPSDKPQKVYTTSLEQIGKINLGGITEKDVDTIVEKYLYTWGGMGRVLGRKDMWDDWQVMSGNYENESPVWSQGLKDLTIFAGNKIRIAFYHYTNNDIFEDLGWYIDDVILSIVIPYFDSPDDHAWKQ